MGEVFRYVRLLVGPSDCVEDIVQETMVHALMSFGRYDPQRPLAGWLCGIAHKVVYKHWRRVRRTREFDRKLGELGAGRGAGATPEEEALLRERSDLLYRALDTLSPHLRETLILYAGERFPAEEVARLTGSSVAGVYVRVSRAREAVREFVRRAGKAAGDEGESG